MPTTVYIIYNIITYAYYNAISLLLYILQVIIIIIIYCDIQTRGSFSKNTCTIIIMCVHRCTSMLQVGTPIIGRSGPSVCFNIEHNIILCVTITITLHCVICIIVILLYVMI